MNKPSLGATLSFSIAGLIIPFLILFSYSMYSAGLTTYLLIPAAILSGFTIIIVFFVHPKWLLFITLFLLPLELLQQVVPDYITVGKFTALLTFVAFIFYFIFRTRQGLQWNGFLTFFFVYALYCVLSYFIHYQAGTPLAPFLSVTSLPVLALLTFNLINSRKDFNFAFLFLAMGFLISNVLTVFQYILQDPIIDIGFDALAYDVATGAVKYSGTFGNPNSFAIFLLSCLFIFGYLNFNCRNFWLRNFIRIVFISSLIALMLTASAAAFLGVLIAVLLYLWFKIPYKTLSLAAGAIVLALIIIIPNPLTNRIALRFQEEGRWRDPSTVMRLKIFEKSWNMFVDKPVFGIGFGQFDVQSPDYLTYRLEHYGAHNNFLKVLAETGLVGIFIYTAMLLWLFKRLLTFYVKTENQTMRNFIIAALMTLVATIIFSLFHTTMRSSIVWAVYAIIAKFPAFMNEEDSMQLPDDGVQNAPPMDISEKP